MSTPLIWIASPIIVAIVLSFPTSKPKLSSILGISVSLLLFLTALIFPENLVITVGSFTMEFSPSIYILGRSISIDAGLLPFVALIYLITTLWIIGSAWFQNNGWFRPISLAIAPLLISALAVEPFLYAALLIELAVLLSVPLLTPKNEGVSKGVLRFLTFQTLAMPLILMSGWMLSGIETAPSTSPLISRATVMLMLGFTLWLAVFPFHSWLPMVSETSNSWNVSFIVSLLPTTLLMFLLTFFDRYAWLRSVPNLNSILISIGILMVVIGGLFISVQRHLGRAFGYAVMVETGFCILAIGLVPQNGLSWLSMSFFPRIIGYWIWCFSMGALQEKTQDLSFENIKGVVYNYPFMSAGILLGQLSLAGLPMLASFPVKRMFWLLTTETSLINSLWLFLGSIGLFIFSLRTLRQTFLIDHADDRKWAIKDPLRFIIPICIMTVLILLIGVFPHWFLPYWMNLLKMFEQFSVIP